MQLLSRVQKRRGDRGIDGQREWQEHRALEQIEKEIEPYPEIVEIVEFYRSSKRGVVKKQTEPGQLESEGE